MKAIPDYLCTMKKIGIIVLVALALMLVFQVDVEAQCAMCRMNAENASKESQGFAQGLNNGIVYLMGIPYILLFLGGLVFYRSFIKKAKNTEA